MSELLCYLYGHQVPDGILVAWVELAAEGLAPTLGQIAGWLKGVHSSMPMKSGSTDLDDLLIPFFMNQAERDLRMVPRPTKDRRNVSQCTSRSVLCWLRS